MAASIDTTVVSSDSDEMLRMTNNCDEKIKPFGAVAARICENVKGDDIVWATCTSPLVEPRHYIEAIEKYKEVLHRGCASLMPVRKCTGICGMKAAYKL